MPAMTFEQILKEAKPPTGCGVLVIRDGKILTGTRIERAGKGRLCGPGGHIEAGETPEEAAKREAMEEFGIECHDLVPLDTQDGGGRYGTSAVFVCTDYTGEPRTDEEEMTDPKWRTIEEIKEEDLFPPFKQSLELLQEGDLVRKFNPYHCHTGRFTTANGAHSFTYSPGKSKAHDLAIEREKKRHAAAGSSNESKAPSKPQYKGNNATQKDHLKETHGDMDHMFDDDSRRKCIETCEKMTGADKDQATSFYNAVQSYTGGGYDSIRDYYQTGNTWGKREAENLEKFIEASPKWDGGDLYRGIAVKKDTADQILKYAREGKEMGMMGPSSWSSKESIAQSFADSNATADREVKFIFKTSGKQNGTSVKYMSITSYEDEVVCSNEARWKPTKVKEIGKGVYEIDCTPVSTGGTTKKSATFDEILKFNPYHGPDGKFSTANGAHSFTYKPGKSKAHDLAIEREKKRQEAAGGAGGATGTGSSEPEYKPPETRGHVKHMKGQELFDYTAKELGVSKQEAKDMIKEVSGYTDGAATDMRIWQQGGKQWDMQELTPKEAQKMSDEVEKYIKKAPKWEGGEIYRGIGISEDEAHKLLDDIAFSMKPLDMKGTSSWTSDKSIADDFSEWNGADVAVIFKAPGTKKGTSIDHISDFSQSEVLVSKDARWDVKNISGSIDDGYLVIEMEERP